MHQPTVAIIGAGFSGSLLALKLLSATPAGTRILLIERSGRFGPGLAYGTAGPDHLLNVPAGRMSPFAECPLHFVDWLQRRAEDASEVLPTATSFVPRRQYGAYLRHLLDRGCREAGATSLELLQAEVVTLAAKPHGVTLRLASGETVSITAAVLATGNAPPLPPHPTASSLATNGGWQCDPWLPAAFADLDPDAAVLLVGTGLTMADALVTLLDAAHKGPIHALSRHGLLPREHSRQPSVGAALTEPLPTGLLSLLRYVRREIAALPDMELGWRPVIDGLRPHSHALWRGMSEADRQRFLRHLCTYWDVHRHRLPPQVAERIKAAQASGQLRIHAGHITKFAPAGSGAAITWRRRGTDMREVLEVERVINCSGPPADITRSTNLLLRALLLDGTVRRDPLGLGLDVTTEGVIRDHNGGASSRLYAVGPLTKGAWWEMTAVPDIRQQCLMMAKTLASRLAADRVQPGWADPRPPQTAPARVAATTPS